VVVNEMTFACDDISSFKTEGAVMTVGCATAVVETSRPRAAGNKDPSNKTICPRKTTRDTPTFAHPTVLFKGLEILELSISFGNIISRYVAYLASNIMFSEEICTSGCRSRVSLF
jgi:hypothetical protein